MLFDLLHLHKMTKTHDKGGRITQDMTRLHYVSQYLTEKQPRQ